MVAANARKIQAAVSVTVAIVFILTVQMKWTSRSHHDNSDSAAFKNDVIFNTSTKSTGTQTVEVEQCFFLDDDKKSRLCSGYSPDSVSVVQSGCDTRFGNQLSVYATLLGFHHKFGLRPFVTKFQREVLRLFFEDVDFPIINTDLLQFWMRPHAIYDGITTGALDSFSYDTFTSNPQPYLGRRKSLLKSRQGNGCCQVTANCLQHLY